MDKQTGSVARRNVLRGMGGLAAYPTSLWPDWLFGEDEGHAEGGTIAVGLEADRDDYDPGDYDLFISSDGETIYRPEDGEWTLWTTTGATPTFNTRDAGRIDAGGRYHGGVILENVPNAALSPGTPGLLVWDEDRGIPAIDDGTDITFPVVGGKSITESQTVANTTTPTSVFTTTLPAGHLQAGRIYRMYIRGRFSTANTSDQFTVTFTVGGTQVSATQSAGQNASGAPFRINMEFTVRQSGENGEIMAYTTGTYADTSQDTPGGGVVSLDTTVSNEVDASVAWTAADPANTLTVEQGWIKEMD